VRDAAAAYSEWAPDREPFLRRARDAARVTLPTLVPPLGHTPESQTVTPYQGLGAQGVTNLASKLLLSLFPPTQPFFRFMPTDPEAVRAAGPKAQQDVEEGLSRMEKVVAAEFETMALRVRLFELLKHLLVAGNGVLHLQPDGSSRMVPLDQYVARRDPMGFLECLIVRECLDRDALPPELAELVGPAGEGAGHDPLLLAKASAGGDYRQAGRARDTVELFTCMEWDPEAKRYRLHQEIAGKQVPGVKGLYKETLAPFLVLRYGTIDGEDYGRGMVEEVLGDLVTLEALTKAVVEAAAIASRCVGMVDPAGAATADDLNRAPNGSFVVGRPTDVSYPQIGKNGDLQVAFSVMGATTDRLRAAFLLNTAVQRQAERVTAEEIRFVAQELEATLGGVFSVLSQELQLPLVEQIRTRLARQGKIQRLPERAVRAAIVTGVEALGRGQELAKINVAMQAAQAALAAPDLNTYVQVRELIGAIFVSAGVDTTKLLRTQAEVDAAAQQQRQMAVAQQFGPEIIKQIGPGVAERMGLAPGQGGAPAGPSATPPK